MLEIITDFLQREYILIITLLIGITIETVSRAIKKRMKRSIFVRYEWSTDPEHGEYYLEYYRKSQIIDVVRVISFLVILALIISLKTASGVNLFVVAAGAFIVAFKDFLLSIVAFFFVLPQYKIGETIGIGEMQGQIIFIRMFSIGILGKDNDGDSTGKLYLIPSNKFITESIRKEDLHTSSIRKELLRIPYKTEQFSLPFDQFLLELEDFLSKNLPTLSKKNCGHFQTYIGHKYKMDIDYLEDKCIILTIGLVGKWENSVEKKKQIVSFIEQYKIKS